MHMENTFKIKYDELGQTIMLKRNMQIYKNR